MSVDYVWVCDGRKEVVSPQALPGCSGHEVTMLRPRSAATLAYLLSRGRWRGEPVRVENDGAPEGEPWGDYADVTAAVAAELAEEATASLVAKAARLNHVGEHATRLQAAIEQNEADAEAMLEALKAATPLLPDDVKAALEARARDILRHDRKALEGEEAHRREILLRAQREDMMRRRIVELQLERDGARAAAHALAGVETKVALGPEAARAAEAFAASALGLSGAEWAKVLEAPPSDRAKAFAAGGVDGAAQADVAALRAELAKAQAAQAKVFVPARGPIEQLASLVATGDAFAPGRTVPSPVHRASRPKAAKAKPARAKATKRVAKKGGKR